MTRYLALFFVFATLAVSGCKKGKTSAASAAPATAAGANGASVTDAAAPTNPDIAAPDAPAASTNVATSASPAAPKTQVDNNASVMALCYHNIEDKGGNKSLTITVAEFERQLQGVKDGGFTVIPMQDFLAWRRGEKNIPAKSCVISIDDGWVSGYTNAWPVLKKFGYPFTLFIYVNYVGSGGKSLSWEQLAEMRDAGVDIQSHTYSHSNLRAPGNGVDAKTKAMVMKDIQTLGKEGWLRKEIAESKKVLEERLGIRVNALAYPFGIYSPEARAMVKEAGYEAAFTVYGQRLAHGAPFDLLGRYAVEAAKPEIFKSALAMVGGGVSASESSGPAVAQLASASMVTEPMDGATINNPKPRIRASIATMGEVEPGSLEMRVSGVGALPVQHDAASKTITAQIAQPLKPGTYTVILGGKVGGQRAETRWTFKFDPAAAPSSPADAPLPKR